MFEFVILLYIFIVDESDGEILSDFGDLRMDEIGGKFMFLVFRWVILMLLLLD